MGTEEMLFLINLERNNGLTAPQNPIHSAQRAG